MIGDDDAMSEALALGAGPTVRPLRAWRGPRLLHAHGLAEPAMMMAAVIGMPIVLDFWLVAGDLDDGYIDPWRQSLAVWNSALRWVPAGLLLTAAATRCFELRMTDAAVVAALTLVGIWAAPLLHGLIVVMPVIPLAVAAGAPAAIWCRAHRRVGS